MALEAFSSGLIKHGILRNFDQSQPWLTAFTLPEIAKGSFQWHLLIFDPHRVLNKFIFSIEILVLIHLHISRFLSGYTNF